MRERARSVLEPQMGLDPGEVFLPGIKQEVQGKAPGGLGHWIKNRKGAKKPYYFLNINIHPLGSYQGKQQVHSSS